MQRYSMTTMDPSSATPICAILFGETLCEDFVEAAESVESTRIRMLSHFELRGEFDGVGGQAVRQFGESLEGLPSRLMSYFQPALDDFGFLIGHWAAPLFDEANMLKYAQSVN